MKSAYKLKRFKNSSDPGITDALKLYSEYTEPAYRTDTREILHWIDKFNKVYEDSFFILGLYFNNVLIGFSELAYFFQEKTVIIDYIVIKSDYRGNNTFYQFMEGIREFLITEGILFDYTIVQVGYFNEKLEPPESSKLWIRLLKMSHFGVVKCKYYLPRLGMNNFESEMKGVLMLYSKNETNQIRKETFFQIVRAVYFKYYLRWYSEFLDENSKIQYSKDLFDLVSIMEKELFKKKYIDINGYSNLFPIVTNSKNQDQRNRLIKVVTLLLSFLICSIFIGLAYLYVKSRFGIDANALALILSAAGLIVIFISAIIYENRSNLFSGLIEKILDKFN